MKKILVTGGAGFIGANLALHLQSKSIEVKVLDNFSSGSHDNLDGFGGEVICGDISEIDTLFKSWRPDVIFHQAAITDTTILDKNTMFRTNVIGFQKVLDCALSCNAKVIYASSAAVYGAGSIPMVESQSLRPLNPYGESKLAVERLAEEYTFKYGMIIIGLRYFNVYGLREHRKGKMASMIWQLALQMTSGKQPCIFKWGQQQRDPIYVEDVIKANLLALKSNASGIYNIGTGRAVSFNEIIRILDQVIGYSYEPNYFDNPYDFYQKKTLADTTKAKEVIGFETQYDLKTGIEDYFKKVNVKEFIC